MRKQKGFTLIELMIVVAIVGLLAAIAIPSMMSAIDRAKQKRSMADIRAMVMAMQVFEDDYIGYPFGINGPTVPNLSNFTDGSGSAVIVPSLIQTMPDLDGWRYPYQYYSGPSSGRSGSLGKDVALHFVVYSLGADSRQGGGTDGSASATDIATAWCSNPQPAIPGVQATHCFQSDIVWGDSSFEQSPEGKQIQC
jgi:general secretion pathway protein G